MGKQTDFKDQIWWQSGKGYRARRIATSQSISNVTQNQTDSYAIFVAPCACRVTKISANAIAFVDMDTGGTAPTTVYKANIGAADTALCTAMALGSATVPTAETEIEATLSTTSGALDLIEGQLVYASIATSNHVVDVDPSALVIQVEWMPTER